MQISARTNPLLWGKLTTYSIVKTYTLNDSLQNFTFNNTVTKWQIMDGWPSFRSTSEPWHETYSKSSMDDNLSDVYKPRKCVYELIVWIMASHPNWLEANQKLIYSNIFSLRVSIKTPSYQYIDMGIVTPGKTRFYCNGTQKLNALRHVANLHCRIFGWDHYVKKHSETGSVVWRFLQWSRRYHAYHD